jgi:aspartate aminotransferase-like enzyme
MAKTLASHRSGLLAYYDVMITSGPMEGTNNKIKTMKRQAYGFRDKEFFKLKILAIHETRYELNHRPAGSRWVRQSATSPTYAFREEMANALVPAAVASAGDTSSR